MAHDPAQARGLPGGRSRASTPRWPPSTSPTSSACSPTRASCATGARSRPRSATPARRSRCASAARSCAGVVARAAASATAPAARRDSRADARVGGPGQGAKRAASASSARPRCTRSCSRPASSTTTSRPVDGRRRGFRFSGRGDPAVLEPEDAVGDRRAAAGRGRRRRAPLLRFARSRRSSMTSWPFAESRFAVGSSASSRGRLVCERAGDRDPLLLAAGEVRAWKSSRPSRPASTSSSARGLGRPRGR